MKHLTNKFPIPPHNNYKRVCGGVLDGTTEMAKTGVNYNLYCRGGGGGVVGNKIFVVGGVAVYYCVDCCVGGDAAGALGSIKERIAPKAMRGGAFGGVAWGAVRRTFLISATAHSRAWSTYDMAEKSGTELGRSGVSNED